MMVKKGKTTFYIVSVNNMKNLHIYVPFAGCRVRNFMSDRVEYACHSFDYSTELEKKRIGMFSIICNIFTLSLSGN